MSINLACYVSHNLTGKEICELPKRLDFITVQESEKWHWDDPWASPYVPTEQQLPDVDEYTLWGPGGLTIHFSEFSMEIGFGWAYSRFHHDAENIDEFIEFCIRLAKLTKCRRVYFGIESVHISDCPLTHQLIEHYIDTGEYEAMCADQRRSYYCDHDVYYKDVKESADG